MNGGEEDAVHVSDVETGEGGEEGRMENDRGNQGYEEAAGSLVAEESGIVVEPQSSSVGSVTMPSRSMPAFLASAITRTTTP